MKWYWVYIAFTHDMGRFKFERELSEKESDEMVMKLRTMKLNAYRELAFDTTRLAGDSS